MDLIPHETFTRLRLRQFDPSASDDTDSDSYEFMDLFWFEESVRGAEFLRHEHDPHRLGAIGLDFRYLPPQLTEAILSAIQLPLRSGMSIENVTQLLGNPSAAQPGAPDCLVRDFNCGPDDGYHVRCYFTDGLHAVDIIRKDLLKEQSC